MLCLPLMQQGPVRRVCQGTFHCRKERQVPEVLPGSHDVVHNGEQDNTDVTLHVTLLVDMAIAVISYTTFTKMP